MIESDKIEHPESLSVPPHHNPFLMTLHVELFPQLNTNVVYTLVVCFGPFFVEGQNPVRAPSWVYSGFVLIMGQGY